jgi:hypothetical protein
MHWIFLHYRLSRALLLIVLLLPCVIVPSWGQGTAISKVPAGQTPRLTLRFVLDGADPEKQKLVLERIATQAADEEPVDIVVAQVLAKLKEFIDTKKGTVALLLPTSYQPRLTISNNKTIKPDSSEMLISTPTGYEINVSKLPDSVTLKFGRIDGQKFKVHKIHIGTDSPSVLILRSPVVAPPVVASKKPATADEIVDFLQKHPADYPGFQPNQLYQNNGVTYLFVNRNLHIAPGTAWPDCNQKPTTYQLVVVDKEGDVPKAQYLLETEVAVVRDTELRIYAPAAAAIAGAPDPVKVLGEATLAPRAGTLLITATLYNTGAGGNDRNLLVRRAFRLSDCDLGYHVGLMLGINASFLSNPTNIAVSQLPNSTDYTLVADDPTTHQALTVMALFYPTPRRYGYNYKDLGFFQKFNVSVGSQVGPTLLGDVLVGLNYEMSRGLNLGAGGHYGRRRVIIGQPGFEFGKDVYAGGANFSEAVNTRMQWDLAWYVGIGIDLRVIGPLFGRSKEITDLRGVTPTTTGTSEND